LLGSYQEYFTKSVSKQGAEFLIAALVKTLDELFIGDLDKMVNPVPEKRPDWPFLHDAQVGLHSLDPFAYAAPNVISCREEEGRE
jgi:hypothetical protein